MLLGMFAFPWVLLFARLCDDRFCQCDHCDDRIFLVESTKRKLKASRNFSGNMKLSRELSLTLHVFSFDLISRMNNIP